MTDDTRVTGGGHGPSGPTGGFVRGYERNLRCVLQCTKIMIRMIHLDFSADLEIPDKKGFCGD